MGKDKYLHLIAGFVIALAVGLFNPIAGIIAPVTIGAAKEMIWDMAMRRGTFEMLDFLATVLGGMVGTATAILAINYLL